MEICILAAHREDISQETGKYHFPIIFKISGQVVSICVRLYKYVWKNKIEITTPV